MNIFAVMRRGGPALDPARPVEEQVAWGQHASFMLGLAGEGALLMAGPLGAREGALLILRAEDETQVHALLAADPWTIQGVLETDWVKPWDVRIGAGLG